MMNPREISKLLQVLYEQCEMFLTERAVSFNDCIIILFAIKHCICAISIM